MSPLLRIITVIMSPLLRIITRSIIRNNGLIITYYWPGQLADRVGRGSRGRRPEPRAPRPRPKPEPHAPRPREPPSHGCPALSQCTLITTAGPAPGHLLVSCYRSIYPIILWCSEPVTAGHSGCHSWAGAGQAVGWLGPRPVGRLGPVWFRLVWSTSTSVSCPCANRLSKELLLCTVIQKGSCLWSIVSSRVVLCEAPLHEPTSLAMHRGKIIHYPTWTSSVHRAEQKLLQPSDWNKCTPASPSWWVRACPALQNECAHGQTSFFHRTRQIWPATELAYPPLPAPGGRGWHTFHTIPPDPSLLHLSRLFLVASIIFDSTTLISPVASLLEGEVKSKTVCCFCDAVSRRSFDMISLKRTFWAILNWSCLLSSSLRIGTHFPTLALFCPRTARPRICAKARDELHPVNTVSQNVHITFLAPPRLLWTPSIL